MRRRLRTDHSNELTVDSLMNCKERGRNMSVARHPTGNIKTGTFARVSKVSNWGFAIVAYKKIYLEGILLSQK